MSKTLMISNSSPPGIAVVDFGTIKIVSCYLSPNADRADVLEFYDHLSDIVDSTRKPIIIAGDLNSKSPMWGSAITNRRGRLLEDWIAEKDFCVVNTGSQPTCVRFQGSSIVDITLCTPDMLSAISSWVVLEEMESLSDHNYIQYEVSSRIYTNTNNITHTQTHAHTHTHTHVHSRTHTQAHTHTHTQTHAHTHIPRRLNENRIRGWSWKTLEEDKFLSVLIWHTPEALNMLSQDSFEPNSMSTRIKEYLAEAADFSAKKRKGYKGRKSTYWWSEDIYNIRKETITARRKWTKYLQKRNRNDFSEHRLSLLYSSYKTSKKNLRQCIFKAKDKAWKDLLLTIDEDPWGLPFKIVTAKLRRSNPSMTELLDDSKRAKVLTELFPPDRVHDPDILWHNYQWRDQWTISYSEVNYELTRRPLKGAAPGLDGIPDKIIKLLPDCFIEFITAYYNKCIQHGIFPDEWKKGRLVLIPKQDGMINNTNNIPKMRPICILDELGKAFERIICRKINDWMKDNPQYMLSENQYGFVEGKSTTDALCRVVNIVEDAFSNNLVVIAISLDIQNAFNSIPWKTIRTALKDKHVPDYVRRLIDSYLHNRFIIYTVKNNNIESRAIQSGVPQGSVLGPLLWNIGYDSVLHKRLKEHSCLTCYADDTLLLTAAADPDTAIVRASLQIHIVLGQIRKLGLNVATHKTKVALFSRSTYETRDMKLIIDKDEIQVTDTFKYLGVFLDQKLTFRPHFEYAISRSKKVTGALTGLMPNLRGPCESKRKLFGNVILSVLLYGAPVWSSYLNRNKNMINKMNQAMKSVANRICCGYRTVSLEAASLLARVPPATLLAECRRRNYERVRDLYTNETYSTKAAKEIKREEELLLMRQWQICLNNAKYGHRTVNAILPFFTQWMNRRHGLLEFHLTQALTGHGCFGFYLDKIQKADTPLCLACNEDRIDTADHTIMDCSRWINERNILTNIIGDDLCLETIVGKILESKQKWVAFTTFCRRIILTKENEERARQARRTRSRSLDIRSSTDHD